MGMEGVRRSLSGMMMMRGIFLCLISAGREGGGEGGLRDQESRGGCSSDDEKMQWACRVLISHGLSAVSLPLLQKHSRPRSHVPTRKSLTRRLISVSS
jgi:hypothetical protein